MEELFELVRHRWKMRFFFAYDNLNGDCRYISSYGDLNDYLRELRLTLAVPENRARLEKITLIGTRVSHYDLVPDFTTVHGTMLEFGQELCECVDEVYR